MLSNALEKLLPTFYFRGSAILMLKILSSFQMFDFNAVELKIDS